MPKKKTPKNAFYFFMRDYKQEQEQLGYVFHEGMKEVADLAGPIWKEISPDQRLHYEKIAAQEKMKEKGNLENKFTTTGVSYAQLQREEEERRTTELRMKMEMEGTIQGLNRETTLKTHIFYFIHFNYYCRIEDGTHLICEVAIAQFNLRDGVKDVYHTVIRHDRIPTGYSYEARQTSEDTHQIPMPQDLEEGEPYHGNLFCYIKSFLEQNKLHNGLLPPLYTLDNHVDIAQGALTVLAEYHYPQDPDIFRVYPLSKLFYLLRNASAPPGSTGFPAETLAERELDKDQYNFAPGIACSMHDKNDTCVYCSKSIVQRWAFLICDHCCRDLGINMLRGKHIPINAALSVELQQDEAAGGDFQRVTRRNPRAQAGPSSTTASAVPLPSHSGHKIVNVVPIKVIDHSKIGPPEETAHHFNLNASAGTSSAGNAWGSGRGLVWGAAASAPAPASAPGPVPTPTRMPVVAAPGASSGEREVGGAAAAAASAGATPKQASKGWGPKPVANGELPSAPTLRRPNTIPPSIANALKFSDDDFPDLGESSRVRTPAAVAGRGRGRAKILLTEQAPGRVNGESGGETMAQVAAGRSRNHHGGKPGSRLAANFLGLNLD